MKYINKKHVLPFILLLGLSIFSSCRKDKEMNNIKEVNRIVIGLDSVIYVNKGEQFLIRPNFSFSTNEAIDTANFTYKWEMITTSEAAKYSLSSARDLNMSDQILKGIDGTVLALGRYKLYYRVTDKKTGIFSDTFLTVQITSPIYEGWLALSEVGVNSSRIDMVSQRGSTDVFYHDLLHSMNSNYTLTGKPGFISYANGINLSYVYTNGVLTGSKSYSGICVGTTTSVVFLDQDSVRNYPVPLLGGDMSSHLSYSGLPIPSTWADARYQFHSNSMNLLYADKTLYTLGFYNIGTAVVNKTGGVSFTPSPWTAIGNVVNSAVTAIVYNQDTKTFLKISSNETSCSALPAGPLFNFSTGMDLQYMSFSPYNGGTVYAVLKNSSTGKRYLACFTTAGQQIAYGELTLEGISDQSLFAVSPEQGYLLYTAGNKLLEYDVLLNKSFLMHDYGAKNISLLKFQRFYDQATNLAAYNVLSKKLIVATYTPGDLAESGTMELYTVPDINGALQLHKSYSGFGKVVSVAYMQK